MTSTPTTPTGAATAAAAAGGSVIDQHNVIRDARIVAQTLFYFSEHNLRTDRYLRALIRVTDESISLTSISNLDAIRKLTLDDPYVLVEALKNGLGPLSSPAYAYPIGLSDDNTRLCFRKPLHQYLALHASLGTGAVALYNSTTPTATSVPMLASLGSSSHSNSTSSLPHIVSSNSNTNVGSSISSTTNTNGSSLMERVGGLCISPPPQQPSMVMMSPTPTTSMSVALDDIAGTIEEVALKCVMVENIPRKDLKVSALSAILEKFGPVRVVSIQTPLDMTSADFSGPEPYAVVEFFSRDDAERAARETDEGNLNQVDRGIAINTLHRIRGFASTPRRTHTVTPAVKEAEKQMWKQEHINPEHEKYIDTIIKGKVQSTKGSFGFIFPDFSEKLNIFFHSTNIIKHPKDRKLKPDDEVTFKLVRNAQNGKLNAIDVSCVKSAIRPLSPTPRSPRSHHDALGLRNGTNSGLSSAGSSAPVSPLVGRRDHWRGQPASARASSGRDSAPMRTFEQFRPYAGGPNPHYHNSSSGTAANIATTPLSPGSVGSRRGNFSKGGGLSIDVQSGGSSDSDGGDGGFGARRTMSAREPYCQQHGRQSAFHSNTHQQQQEQYHSQPPPSRSPRPGSSNTATPQSPRTPKGPSADGGIGFKTPLSPGRQISAR